MPQEEKVESEGRVRRRAVFPRSDEELMKESEGDGSDDDDEEEEEESSDSEFDDEVITKVTVGEGRECEV